MKYEPDTQDALTMLKQARESGSHEYTNLTIAYLILKDGGHSTNVMNAVNNIAAIRKRIYGLNMDLSTQMERLNVALKDEIH